MAATQDRPASGADREDPPEAQMPPPTPDEDGPHDVPDEKVIEKTLPTTQQPKDGDGQRG